MRDDPWSGLGITTDHIIGRRVAGEHPLDIYWIKGSDGSPGLLFRGVDPERLPEQMPKPRGLMLEVATVATGSEVRMLLREREDHEVFLTLCRDVVAFSGGSATAADATTSVFRRLSHWHSMMTRARTTTMGPHEVRGLMGELVVFERLCRALDFDAGLRAWAAPDEHPQDFAMQERLVEVKARLSGARQTVRISSLQQLEPSQLPIALVVVELVSAEGADAATLNQLCTRLIDRARELGNQQLDAIEVALFKRGYIRNDAYDVNAYRVAGMSAFDCREGFPRIIRSQVDARVPEAQYVLDLVLIGEFEIPVASVLD